MLYRGIAEVKPEEEIAQCLVSSSTCVLLFLHCYDKCISQHKRYRVKIGFKYDMHSLVIFIKRPHYGHI